MLVWSSNSYYLVQEYNRNTLWLRDTVRQAAGPTKSQPRPLTSPGMSAWPYRVTTKYSFYPVQAYKMLNKKMIALTVLWNEKYSDLMANYLSIILWRRPPSELMSPVKWRPRAEGPTLCSISQGLHLAHKTTAYNYGFIPYLVIKKIASNHPYIVDWRPAFAVTSQYLGIPLRSARVVTLFKWAVRILRSARLASVTS